MSGNSGIVASSSKKAKKNSPHDTVERVKLQLDSEKSLHDVQCFAEELFASRSYQRSHAVSFVDPIVNLNIDLLQSRNQGSSSSSDTALVRKLNDEIEQLRRAESNYKINEKLLQKKDAIILDLKKEAAQTRVWMGDLQEQNDRLSSQLFMFQMQQNAFNIQMQQSKGANDNDAEYEDVDRKDMIKPEDCDNAILTNRNS